MLRRKTVNGHLALCLENEQLRVGVLPEKGADIFELVHKATSPSQDVQFLMRTPWGLKPPQKSRSIEFLDNYEGGWQELFPNANDGCQYHGQDIPFHGEVALQPWQFEVPRSDAENVLRLWVNCRMTPFRLERVMCLEGSQLTLRESVTNLGSDPCDFVWGHHLTLGGDFLEDGCVLEIPAAVILTPDVLFEPLTARLESAQAERWPFALSRHGGYVDLRDIRGPDCHSHDDVILGGLEHGFYRVTNPRLNLSFSLEWNVDVFPWLMFWQPYGGADLPPLTGIYGVGLEPWVSRYPLAQAVDAGQARSLDGGQSLETELLATVGAA